MSSPLWKACAAVLPVALCLGFIGASEEAKACSIWLCGITDLAPADGEQVPANVPALTTRVFERAVGSFNLELVSSGGAEVPFVLEPGDRSGGHLIRPSQPLLEDETYSLRFSETCEYPPDAGTFEFTFRTSVETPLPTSAGALSLRREGHWNVIAGMGGPCSDVFHSAYAQFAFAPSPSAAAFLPVTRWVLEVDGTSWTHGVWEGEVLPDGGLRRASPLAGTHARRPLFVHAACPDAGLGADRGLEEGTHTAVLKGKVAGTDVELATQPVEFTLSCSGEALEPLPYEEGFQPQPAPPVIPTRDEEKRSGCAAAGGGGLATLLLFGALLRRRRSRAS